MRHIHIVEPYHSEAMRKLAQPLLEYLPRLYNVTMSEIANESADLNIHIPHHTLGDAPNEATKNIVSYTHINPGQERLALLAAERADVVVTMSFEGRRELERLGVSPQKIWTIYCAANLPLRKRIIGIVGFVQPNGRKREHILLDLAWKYDLTPYEFLFIGGGWEGIVEQLKALGVSAHGAQVEADALQGAYRYMDALLVTGYREGGPLPLLDAYAAGVPVFAPRVGYAADLQQENFYDGADDLMRVMNNFFARAIENHLLTRAWTWQDYAAEYAMLIGRLLGEEIDLFPERGASRYEQLFEIIEERAPQSICEIGVWNGTRALQMIQQAARHHPMERIRYHGFDLFEDMNDETLRRENSKMPPPLNVVRRRLNATGAQIALVRGDTRKTLRDNIPDADIYFVDGGHSEETIANDGQIVLERLRDENIAIFDDFYYGDFPAGCGCNRFIASLDPQKFEIRHLPVRTQSDGYEIGMVTVCQRTSTTAQTGMKA